MCNGIADVIGNFLTQVSLAQREGACLPARTIMSSCNFEGSHVVVVFFCIPDRAGTTAYRHDVAFNRTSLLHPWPTHGHRHMALNDLDITTFSLWNRKQPS